MRNISQQAMDKVESIASKMVNKVMGKAFKRDLPSQVVAARKMMRMSGVVETRANLLKDRGIPSDVMDLVKAGWTAEQIKEYYWSCKEFREFWSDIQCSEAMLDSIISDAFIKYITVE